jgi:hypothetical protein
VLIKTWGHTCRVEAPNARPSRQPFSPRLDAQWHRATPESLKVSPAATTIGGDAFSGPHPRAIRIATVVIVITVAILLLAPTPLSTSYPWGQGNRGISPMAMIPSTRPSRRPHEVPSAILYSRVRGKDASLRSTHTIPMDSLSLFSESPSILRLFGARRLSQHNLILSFPSPARSRTRIYEGIPEVD